MKKHMSFLLVILLSFFAGCSYSAKNLYEAIENDDNEKIIRIIEKNPELVNEKNEEGLYPLHLAAREGNQDAVEAIIAAGADVNSTDDNGKTPLFYAKNSQTIEILAVNKADLNITDKEGNAPLHYTVSNKETDLATALLKKGADPMVKNSEGKTPLHLAVEKDSVGLGSLLIENKAEVNAVDTDGDTPLHLAAEKKTLEMARLLVDNKSGIDLKNEKGETPLHKAVLSGDQKIISYLLENAADINAKDQKENTPLHLAAQKGDEKTVLLLLEKGVFVRAKNKDGLTPEQLASEGGFNKIVSALKKFAEEQGEGGAQPRGGWASFFPLREGNYWVYESVVSGSMKMDMEFRVGKDQVVNGTKCHSMQSYVDGKPAQTEYYELNNKGLFAHRRSFSGGSVKLDMDLVPPQEMIKFPLIVNKTWTWNGSVGGHSTGKFSYSVVKKEKIRVPAGTFEAYQIKMEGKVPGQASQSINVNRWFASGVGMVKEESRMGQLKVVAELKSYKVK